MVFTKDSLANVLNKTAVIITSQMFMPGEREAGELAGLLRANIAKRDFWTLDDFLIELEVCLAFFLASNKLPSWLAEHYFEIMLGFLSQSVDQSLGVEIAKLRYDEAFVKRKFLVVNTRQDPGELPPGLKN